MKKLMLMMFCMLALSVRAVDFTPASQQREASSMSMQSVNSQSYMTTGSALSPAVYEVGSSSPAKGPQRPGSLRREGGPGDTGGASDYDPKTPTYEGPIGDAVLPLMLMALAYLGMRVFRARKRALNG